MSSLPYPNISIVTPIYDRNNFKHLIISNLLQLDYDLSKIEFIMDDDSPIDRQFISSREDFKEFQNIIKPIKFVYKWYQKKRSIGEKRNNLCKLATNKIIGNMDSDDIMISSWLKHSIDTMRSKNYKLVGTNQMIFTFPAEDYKCTAIQCGEKRMIHEAGMVFKKQHWKATGGFLKNSQGEGTSLIDNMNPRTVGLTKAENVIVCICHRGNTVCKDRFFDSQQVKDFLVTPYHKAMISRCV